uniref:Uncharacterized protein n=1 Tax=Arundo donax TaxID=35708 RepID=A0A0A9EA36_ARUDO
MASPMPPTACPASRSAMGQPQQIQHQPSLKMPHWRPHLWFLTPLLMALLLWTRRGSPGKIVPASALLTLRTQTQRRVPERGEEKKRETARK